MKYFLVSLILFILSLSACKKDSELSDYRFDYVGKYQTLCRVSSYGIYPASYSETDTVLSVDYGSEDSTIIVLGNQIKANINGVSYYFYHGSITINNDTLKAFYMSGGLGGGQNISYEGYRISYMP